MYLRLLRFSEASDIIRNLGLDTNRATAKKPYACSDCGESSFTEYKYLKFHRARHCQTDEFGQRLKVWTPNSRLRCEHCKKVISNKKKVCEEDARHLKVVHVLQEHPDKVQSILDR